MASKRSCCGRALESCEEGLVCLECGIIVEITNFVSDLESGNAMTCDGTMKWAGGKVGLHTAHRGTSNAIKCMQACLFKQVKALRLSSAVASQIRSFLFDTVYPARKSWKMSPDRKIVAACCVYIVCRQNRMAISFRNVARLADCCVHPLGRNVKTITEKLGITLDILEADAFMPSALSQFGIEDKTLETLSFDLLELCNDSLLNNGKNPVVVAVSVVILAMEGMGKRPSKATVVKVCGESGFTQERARAFATTVKDQLMVMAKEIPWLTGLMASSLNPVNRRTVAKFIPDIVKFHKQCGKHHSNVMKPTWLEEKEKIQSKRSKEIHDAKLRIASKRENFGDDGGIPDGNAQISSASKIKQAVPDTSLDSPLDSDAKLIEYLLQKGCAESQVAEGNLESLYYSYQSADQTSTINMEREDLDERDISRDDLHKYLRSPEEIKTVKMIHLEEEADAPSSKKLKTQP